VENRVNERCWSFGDSEKRLVKVAGEMKKSFATNQYGNF
jgi:hypothetical protein